MHITRHPLWLRSALLAFSILLYGIQSIAQTTPMRPDHDTTYYESYTGSLIGRAYFSKKYTGLEFDRPSGSRLRYEPNTALNLGVGVTYHNLTINLAYGFPFLNPVDGKGKTKYLDLQTHFYAREWTIDLLGQFYKGYYLTPKGLAADSPDSFYIRPDLRINMGGIAVYHLFNSERFSFRAPIFQDEKQKKSAGSFLLGAEAYYGVIKADSSVVPAELSDQYSQRGIRSFRFFKIGPGAGYAHTFIIASDFFCMASLQANLGVDFTHQAGGKGGLNKVSLSPGYIYRLVAGYDKGVYNLNISVVGNQLSLKPAVSDDKIFITTGTYRLTLTRRFYPGPKLKRKLKPIDDFLPN